METSSQPSSSSISISSSCSRFRFRALHSGTISVGKQYCSPQILASLFCLNKIVVLDAEGEELSIASNSNLFSDLQPDILYTVVDETQLEESDSESEDLFQKIPSDQAARLQRMKQVRIDFVKTHYQPLHPNVYIFSKSFLAPVQNLQKETETGVYSLQVFTDEFCREFLEELEAIEHSGVPLMRPNTMNNYGIIIDEVGFEGFLNSLRTEFIQSLSTQLFPQFSTLDSHHGFVVTYKIGEDIDLGFHYDDSEVTLNVCLGKQFTGGSLYFCGLLDDEKTHDERVNIEHSLGKGILHIGKHRHGANAIQSGSRYNLIVWCRESRNRCSCCGKAHTHS